MKCRRAISEILSAVIIIAVVVSGMGLYVGLSQQRILGDTNSVRDVIIQSREKSGEILEQVSMFRNDTYADIIEVYVFNSGLKNVTIAKAFVNGTIPVSDVYVKDLAETPIWPDSSVLPVGNMTKIVLNFTDTQYAPASQGISSLVIVTESSKIIELANQTSN